MNFLRLKNAIRLFFFLGIAITLQAQPGPPYTVHNLNELTSRPINSYKEHYYIDSTTDLNQLALLAGHSELTSLALTLPAIPAGLMVYGKYLEELNINSPRYTEATNKNKVLRYDTLRNLSQLNDLPNLKTINVYGFVIDNKESVPETAKPAGALKQLSFSHSVIFNFPEQLSLLSLGIGRSDVKSYKGLQSGTTLRIIRFYGVPMKNLPPDLPGSLSMIYLDACDSLQSVESLSLYPGLTSISIRDCKNINRFPSAFSQNKLEYVSIKLKPAYTGSLLTAIQPVDSIRVLELDFYPGPADLDFKNMSYHIGRLRVTGASYGTKTQMRFRNTDSLSVKEIRLFGDLDKIPDFSKVIGLSVLDFGCSIKPSKYYSSESLAGLKNLRSFTIRNCNITGIPAVFFEHNPDLEHLAVLYTDLKHLSFGGSVLKRLKSLMLHDNPELESIPPKRFYPNAYRPDLQRNPKLKQEEN